MTLVDIHRNGIRACPPGGVGQVCSFGEKAACDACASQSAEARSWALLGHARGLCHAGHWQPAANPQPCKL